MKTSSNHTPHTAHRSQLIAFCFLLSTFCFLASDLFAQPQKNYGSSLPKENRKAFFGIYFGPTMDWFAPTVPDLIRNASKAGFMAGVNIDARLTKEKIVFFSTGITVRYLQGELSFKNRYSIIDTSTYTVRTYQTMYLVIPTGVNFKAKVADRCILLGQLGLYHNFKVGGKQFDNFSTEDEEYFISTKTIKNKDAALFAESGYVGLGFEYLLGNNTSVFAKANFGCQFNYFNKNAKNNVTNEQFKSIAHSLQIVVGILF